MHYAEVSAAEVQASQDQRARLEVAEERARRAVLVGEGVAQLGDELMRAEREANRGRDPNALLRPLSEFAELQERRRRDEQRGEGAEAEAEAAGVGADEEEEEDDDEDEEEVKVGEAPVVVGDGDAAAAATPATAAADVGGAAAAADTAAGMSVGAEDDRGVDEVKGAAHDGGAAGRVAGGEAVAAGDEAVAEAAAAAAGASATACGAGEEEAEGEEGSDEEDEEARWAEEERRQRLVQESLAMYRAQRDEERLRRSTALAEAQAANAAIGRSCPVLRSKLARAWEGEEEEDELAVSSAPAVGSLTSTQAAVAKAGTAGARFYWSEAADMALARLVREHVFEFGRFAAPCVRGGNE